MPRSTYNRFTVGAPTLRALYDLGGRARRRDLLARLTERLGLTASDLADVQRSNGAPKKISHIDWALQGLQSAEFVAKPCYASWELTDAGVDILARPGSDELVFDELHAVQRRKDIGDAHAVAAHYGYCFDGDLDPDHEVVYAVEALGAWKWGKSLLRRFDVRLRAIQAAVYTPLRVVTLLPGDLRVERAIHAALGADLIHGEWYRPSPLGRLLAAGDFTVRGSRIVVGGRLLPQPPSSSVWRPSFVLPSGPGGAKPGDDVVYFVQTASGPVKIGKSGVSTLLGRMATLQAHTPERLTLLGCIRGGLSLENELHAQFQPWRILNEWFEPVDDLLALARGRRRSSRAA